MFIHACLSTLTHHFRRCDSRNINLSPLCDLNNIGNISLWQDEIDRTYNEVLNGSPLPGYINKTSGLMRRYNPKATESREIIRSLVETVGFHFKYLLKGVQKISF